MLIIKLIFVINILKKKKNREVLTVCVCLYQQMSYELRFISPSSTAFDELEKLVARTCPQECIISIEEIVNQTLEKRYQDRRKELNDAKEVRVFHGSRNFDAVHSILLEGFRSELNTVSAFGRGTYFATSYGYSKNYASRENTANTKYTVMLICDVSYTRPIRGRTNQILDPREGDCWVDSVARPTIYSVPNNDQCIPRYLVRFYSSLNGGD